MEWTQLEVGRMVLHYGIVLTVLTATAMAYSRRKKLKRRVFAWIYGRYLAPVISRELRPCKEELFAPLKTLNSRDPKLANEGQGVLRILEIGIGTGLNLEFYPPGTRLVSVEPNSHFTKFFDKNREKLSHVQLEKSVLGTAEDMSEIEDNSIDVVVSTYVLCSVQDVNAVLKEIHRVLMPNGKFFYIEHVKYQNGSWGFWLQRWLEPVWQIFTDDCRVTTPTSDYIGKCGFSNISEKNMLMTSLTYLIKPHIVGVATK